MLSVKRNLLCWTGAVLVAITYAAVPCREAVFPAVLASLLCYRLIACLSPRAKTPKLPLNDREDWHAIIAVLVLLSLGRLAKGLSLSGSRGSDDWRHVAVLHALLAFALIGSRPRNDALYHPFPRIPRRPLLSHIPRTFYAQAFFVLIAYLEILVFDWGLRAFCGAPAGMRGLFYSPLDDQAHTGHLIACMLLTCPLYDSAETIFFLLHRRFFPSLVPGPHAPELMHRPNREWERGDILEFVGVIVNVLVWGLMKCCYQLVQQASGHDGQLARRWVN